MNPANVSSQPGLMLEPTSVPGPHGVVVTVKPGEWWLGPHRGSKYTLRTILEEGEGARRRKVFLWIHQDQYESGEVAIIHGSVDVARLPAGFPKAMLSAGKPTGSLRVTGASEVLTKVLDELGRWIPKYLGKLSGDWIFPGVDMNPTPKPEKLSVWTGFNFHCGETWAVWTRSGAGSYLYWSSRGFYFRSTEEYPELVKAYLEIRPYGGRLYVTEYGHIWMNLPRNQVSEGAKSLMERKISEFIDSTSSGERDMILSLVTARLKATGCWPMYLGHISDFDSGNPPRTHFKDLSDYRDTIDPDSGDEDDFNDDSWKRMFGGKR